MRNRLGLGLGNNRKASVAASFDPSNVSPTLWLRGDNVTLISSAVSVWPDKSGNGNDYAQGTAGFRPTVATNVINSQSTVQFAQASTQYLTGPSFAALTAGHFFMVWQANGTTLQGIETFGNSGQSDLAPFSGDAFLSIGSTSRPDMGTMNPAGTVAHLIEVISTSAELTMRQNGAQIYTTATNTVGWGALGSIIGGSNAGANLLPAFFFNGDIAEIVLCGAKITGANLTNLKAYFATRYGLTIA